MDRKECVRIEWEGGSDKHCWSQMKVKVSMCLFHLERHVLVFDFISYPCLILKTLSGCGTSGNCNNLLRVSFESHDPFIDNCKTHFCLVIFIYDNMENLFSITLHCLLISQAISPYLIKLLFIKYESLVINLKIIKALVWSFWRKCKAGGSELPSMRRKTNPSIRHREL